MCQALGHEATRFMLGEQRKRLPARGGADCGSKGACAKKDQAPVIRRAEAELAAQLTSPVIDDFTSRRSY